jgi:hypothetical protein
MTVAVGLIDAFALCAAELGMFSASRLFASQLLAEPDAGVVAEITELLGTRFPVFDAVVSRALSERHLEPIDPAAVLDALRGLSRLVVVGIEAECLDTLLGRVPSLRIALVPDALEGANLERVAANYRDEVEFLGLDSFQGWAGRHSGLMTTVYGCDGFQATVCQAWLRAHGPDVRSRFRTLIGWNVLGPKMAAYPRWLGDTDAREFAPLVSRGAAQ